MANLMLSVMGAFVEFERSLIGECHREGIVLVKQRGAYRGRKKSLCDQEITMLLSQIFHSELQLDTSFSIFYEFGIGSESQRFEELIVNDRVAREIAT